MNKKIKINKDNLVVLGLLIISIFSIDLIPQFKIGDELWNFSNIYKMCNGFEIYKDLNVIITPLFFYIGKLLFKLFGANYFTFRIYNVAIYTMFYYLIYKIFIILKVDKKIAKTFIVLIFVPSSILINEGANYNVLSFNFALWGVYLYIKYKDKRLINNILQGIMLFLIFMTKQNIGGFYVIGLIGAKLVEVIENRKLFKSKFLDLVSIASGFTILTLIYGFYLYTNNNLYNAINFTILGIGEFKNNTVITSIIWGIILLLIYIIPIYFVNTKKIELKKDIKYNIKILLSFSIPMLLIMYPIVNKYHMALAIMIGVITLFYSLEVLFLKELFLEMNYKKIVKISLIAGIIVGCIASIITYILKPQKYEYSHPYFGSNITQEYIDSANKVCEYITKNDAYIISAQADLFMNILNKNNGIFDLPFKGNLGKDGQEALIEKIEQINPKIVLIDNEEKNKIYYQNSEQTREYIKSNYKFTGEIENLLIYEK